mgnify:CR=1 FL=1
MATEQSLIETNCVVNEQMLRKLHQAGPQHLRYQGQRGDAFDRWATLVRDRLSQLLRFDALDTLGATGPVRAQVVHTERCEGYTRELVMLDDGLIGPIPTYVLTPEPAPTAARAVLCLHGHGGYYAGKDMVAGVERTHPIARECAEALNYGYGVQMARAGYVAVCPDAFGFGQRMRPSDRWAEAHVCDQYHTMLVDVGLSHIGLTTRGNWRAIDYALALPQVSGDTVGCVGLSYGGVQTMVLAAVDPRAAAAVVSGSLSRCADSDGACGAQSLPGMLEWFDRTDLVIATAPRAVLFELMQRDSCFDFDKAVRTYGDVRHGFEDAGAGERIDLDTADTDHRYIGRRTCEWFERYL